MVEDTATGISLRNNGTHRAVISLNLRGQSIDYACSVVFGHCAHVAAVQRESLHDPRSPERIGDVDFIKVGQHRIWDVSGIAPKG